MSSEKPPTIIKKYANRRLYHMGTSTYVTLEDLAQMVRAGEDFVVQDAKTGDDITRAVLAQIMFEQEGKHGQNMLPTAFLRQLIRFYGDSLQSLVPRYLQFSIDHLTRDQHKLKEEMQNTFGSAALTAIEDQVRANMTFFSDAMRMWSPFGTTQATDKPVAPGESPPSKPAEAGELDGLKRQMQEMQEKLAALTAEKTS